MRDQKLPRPHNYMGQESKGFVSESGNTWLEPESWCYPDEVMRRRARVLMPDGTFKVVRCGLPDTYFSIPVLKTDGDGFIMVTDGEFIFCQHLNSEEVCI